MKRHRFGLVAALATASIAWAVVPATSLAATSKHLASHDGGTLKLTYQGAPGSMDPQINYTLQGWQIEQATQDGLVNFKKAQGTAAYTVVPDLAVAIPKPTDGGKTWVFKMRKGIKFSNGQVVKPTDVLATMQRIFKVHGPTAASFYGSIVGAVGLPEDSGHLHAQGRRDREQREEHGDVPPHEARRRVAAAAGRAAREHRAGRHASRRTRATSRSRARGRT